MKRFLNLGGRLLNDGSQLYTTGETARPPRRAILASGLIVPLPGGYTPWPITWALGPINNNPTDVFPLSWVYKTRMQVYSLGLGPAYTYIFNYNGFYYLDSFSLYWGAGNQSLFFGMLFYKTGASDYYDFNNYKECFFAITPALDTSVLDRFFDLEIRFDYPTGNLDVFFDGNLAASVTIGPAWGYVAPTRNMQYGYRGGGGGGDNGASKIDFITIQDPATGEYTFDANFDEDDLTTPYNYGTVGGLFGSAYQFVRELV